MNNSKILKYAGAAFLGCLCVLGIVFRLYRINMSDFIFYDEGYYLNFRRESLAVIAHHHFHGLADYLGGIYLWLRLSLGTGKALWFMFADMRAF